MLNCTSFSFSFMFNYKYLIVWVHGLSCFISVASDLRASYDKSVIYIYIYFLKNKANHCMLIILLRIAWGWGMKVYLRLYLTFTWLFKDLLWYLWTFLFLYLFCFALKDIYKNSEKPEPPSGKQSSFSPKIFNKCLWYRTCCNMDHRNDGL